MKEQPIIAGEIQEQGFSSFATLVHDIGLTSKTNEKIDLLTMYFLSASSKDKVWLIALFSGRQPRRIAGGALLRQWCMEQTNLPLWLINESYSTVGDLAETIALVLPVRSATDYNGDLSGIMEKIVQLEKEAEAVRKEFVIAHWNQMNTVERFVFNKLLTGNFRIGISNKMVVNALARVTDVSPSVIAHHITGNWDPLQVSFEELISDTGETDHSKPYPFYLAHPLAAEPNTLGMPVEWQAEWKWDGIRGQIIKRNDELFVWSRGEELMTEKFPEYFILKDLLPDGTVIDGEIVTMREGNVLPFGILQTRIGRKNITKKILENAPVGFIAYDIMEWNGEDFRNKILSERRAVLEELVKNLNLNFLKLSEVINFQEWNDLVSIREKSRNYNAEGLMLKRKNSAYGTGRKTGDWWKWKIDPLVIDAVMVYAQKGAGRRSNLYTDYTFAVRDGENLVTFTKAYSGLTDEEFRKVDAFVKKNSLEKFGPVRTVKPELVFEIAFEGIAASNRHKSGVALRFPRINRWRHDKKVEDINTLDDLREMLKLYGK